MAGMGLLERWRRRRYAPGTSPQDVGAADGTAWAGGADRAATGDVPGTAADPDPDGEPDAFVPRPTEPAPPGTGRAAVLGLAVLAVLIVMAQVIVALVR